jgi:hypothetical protein
MLWLLFYGLGLVIWAILWGITWSNERVFPRIATPGLQRKAARMVLLSFSWPLLLMGQVVKLLFQLMWDAFNKEDV